MGQNACMSRRAVIVAVAAIWALSPLCIIVPAGFAQEAPTSEVLSSYIETQSEDARLAELFEEIFKRNLDNSPQWQAHLGIKTDDYGKWDDLSEDEYKRRHEERKTDLRRLRSEFDYDQLNASSQLSYRIFEYMLEQNIRHFKWRYHGYWFSTNGNSATFPVTFLQNLHRIDNVSDAEDYISRLVGEELVMAQIIERIDSAASKGIVSTSFSFEPVLTDSRAVLKGAPFDNSEEDSALLADFRSKVDALDLDAVEKQRLMDAAVAALEGPFARAITAFINKVERLRDQSHGPNGVWALPKGKKYYDERIRVWTTDPDFDADELHEIGLQEVARIRAEMEVVKDEIGFDGDLQEFFEHLRTDPGNFYPDTHHGRQAYLKQSEAYINAVYENDDKYFNLLPIAPLEVRQVEKCRAETAGTAFYNSPSADGKRPGIFYTNLKDMSTRPKHEIEAIAYHEGAPGHHFQIAIQQELTGLPSFRKYGGFGAYTEGWALYAEALMKEIGGYTDPLQEFGRLQNEMWRACRLVVDTGGHAKQWSRQQMIDFMMANTPMTIETATKEVERYLDNPGQALSYKVGMMKILELRDYAQTELGARYDIREFHDAVLQNGAVPLPILEEIVRDYVAAKRTGAE